MRSFGGEEAGVDITASDGRFTERIVIVIQNSEQVPETAPTTTTSVYSPEK